LEKINYNDLTQDDLNLLEDVKDRMIEFGFKQFEIKQTGIIWISFRRNMTSVEYLYWPQRSEIEMIISIGTRKYELKDLVVIPEIREWWTENNKGIAGFRNDSLWFVDLFKFSLPILESR